MGRATLIFRFRQTYDDGAIIEAVVWRLPAPVQGCSHPYKYRLFYGFPGKRIVGYDNERAKGDHKHYRGSESAYNFTGPDALIDDFLCDVTRERSAA